MEKFGSIFSKLVERVRSPRGKNSRLKSEVIEAAPSTPQQSPQALYWSQSRRIHSDPGAELEDSSRYDAALYNHQQQLSHAACEGYEDEDDSVFLNSWEDAEGKNKNIHARFPVQQCVLYIIYKLMWICMILWTRSATTVWLGSLVFCIKL